MVPKHNLRNCFHGFTLILFLFIFLLAGCTAQKDQRSITGSEFQFSASKLYRSIKKQDIVEATFSGRKVLFVVLEDQVYRLGTLENEVSSSILLKRVATKKEMYQLRDEFMRIEKQSIRDAWEMKRLITGFKEAVISEEDYQQTILASIRHQTNADKKERGCLLKLVEEKNRFALLLENSITVGKKNEVNFFFPLNDEGLLSRTDNNKNIVIATIHSHTHDKGLSGSSKEDIAEGRGDISNVKLTEIPWITIGPTQIHAGYLDNHNNVCSEEVNTANLVLYALLRSAKRL